MQQEQLRWGRARVHLLSEVRASVGAVIELPELLVPDVAGWRAVQAAQADGRWERAYEGSATAAVPDDFARAIAANPAAGAQFDALTSRNRYAFLHRLGAVKTAAARQRNIDRFVDMLGRGELFHAQKHPETTP